MLISEFKCAFFLFCEKGTFFWDEDSISILQFTPTVIKGILSNHVRTHVSWSNLYKTEPDHVYVGKFVSKH
jgi:hypothetical protein